MRTIAVVNQKGGCGKTTVAINLASAIAQLGKRVLLVDMDPQSHCAVGLAVPEEQIELSIYDALISYSRNEPQRLSEILWQISDRLELAPASIDLAAFEQQVAGIPEPETLLKRVLDDVSDIYDYVVIDCPPAVGLLTFNALRAATDVIVPVETGYFALHGLSKQLETLGLLCKRCKQQVSVRVLASMYDIRTKMAREVLAQLRSHFADRMLKTVINFNTKIKEAASYGQPINEYDPASKGQQDFKRLAEEIIGIEPSRDSRQIINSLAEQLEAISTSANQLLASSQEKQTQRTRPASQQLTAQPQAPAEQEPAPTAAQTDAKLASYYGVHPSKGAVTFVTLYPRAKTVQIAGDFNNWRPDLTPLQKVNDNGVWQVKLELPPGCYRYRYVVDGQWQQDPYNERVEPNPFGEYNSVVEVT
ncbi:MAG: AAA family ATPase [Sedimentisphaerales bacterium]|jgi:chromosome partitioning protein|nr:AAA family ATPase [Sedimentisphaerales bacterium]